MPDDNRGILAQARERNAQRLMMVYALTGLFFMLLPGTFLGVWNLISISARHHETISAAWIQAHGHAQMLGWIGTFILGIGFYSLPKMAGGAQSASAGWLAWILWTSGAMLRWYAGVYQWHWRVVLPASAVLELCGFLIFLQCSMKSHRTGMQRSSSGSMPMWILAVLAGTAGLFIGLLMNLGGACYASLAGDGPAFPARFEGRLLFMLAYGFIVPTIWGFSARWLPVFLGLKPVQETVLGAALALDFAGVLAAQAGVLTVAPWLVALAAIFSVHAFNLAGPTARPAKTLGVHSSFPFFVRAAYTWLIVATALGIAAAYFDRANGWTGAGRHALTVGFISTMVFSVGQRVLPAFGGMKVLYSPRMMLLCLLLLNAGCTLRVASEILAYEGYWPPAWNVLPYSAVLELAAVTIFATNLVLTFRQPPAHEMQTAA